MFLWGRRERKRSNKLTLTYQPLHILIVPYLFSRIHTMSFIEHFSSGKNVIWNILYDLNILKDNTGLHLENENTTTDFFSIYV